MGRAQSKPPTSKHHVERKMFMYLDVHDRNALTTVRSGRVLSKQDTHGSLTASARQIPAAPADWMDLSGGTS